MSNLTPASSTANSEIVTISMTSLFNSVVQDKVANMQHAKLVGRKEQSCSLRKKLKRHSLHIQLLFQDQLHCLVVKIPDY